MADITATINRPTFNVSVSVASPPVVSVGVQLVRPQVSVEVVQVGQNSLPSPPANLIFVHEQTTPASEWTANHGWGLKAGSIQLEIDSKIWLPDVIETSTSRVVIAFPSPTTGTLTLLRGA